MLERFFRKTEAEATRIMLNVHQQGVGVCGVYTFEIAETKVNQVTSSARGGGLSAALHAGACMISSALKETIHRAVSLAREAGLEYAGAEHLLLALLDDPDAAPVLRRCGVEVESLRDELEEGLAELEPVPDAFDVATTVTTTFERVVQRAVYQMQAAGREGGERGARVGCNFRRADVGGVRAARALRPVQARRDERVGR